MTADFSYIESNDGFVSIMPNTPAAESTYRSIFANGAYRLMPHEFAGFKAQARKAGYTVHKAKLTPIDFNDNLLAELLS